MPFIAGNKLSRGRPPAGKSLSEALRVALTQKLPDGRTNYRAVADALVAKARAGDVSAIREIFDRTEGKVGIVAGDAETRPITINLTSLDEAVL